LDATIALCTEISQLDTMSIQVILVVAPDKRSPFWQYLIDQNSRFSLEQQQAGDLGARLTAAVEPKLERNSKVVCIGSDCPSLQTQDIELAFSQLERVDACIYPAEDGGYVLLGLRRWQSGFFQSIAWSSDQVFVQTLERCQALQLSYFVGEKFRDVDQPADVRAELKMSHGQYPSQDSESHRI